MLCALMFARDACRIVRAWIAMTSVVVKLERLSKLSKMFNFVLRKYFQVIQIQQLGRLSTKL